MLLFIFNLYLSFIPQSIQDRGVSTSLMCTRYCSVTVEVTNIVLSLLITTAFSMPPCKQQWYGIAVIVQCTLHDHKYVSIYALYCVGYLDGVINLQLHATILFPSTMQIKLSMH